VVTVWQPVAGRAAVAWSAESGAGVDFAELDREAAEHGARVAAEGARLAEQAGLRADSLAVKVAGTVWKTILDLADHHDAAAVVMGSRGLTGLRSRLLGSVSSAVAYHSERPTLTIRRSIAGA
jgi:nucleotide-binding universal stress UspA family protein